MQNKPSNILTFKLTAMNIHTILVSNSKAKVYRMYGVLGEKPEKFISINGFLTCRLSTYNWLNCTFITEN